jgi:GNAT superfamily N-acetyltransferase
MGFATMNEKWNHRLAELIEDWGFYFKVYPWPKSLITISKELMQLPFRHIHYKVYACSIVEPVPKVCFDDSFVLRRFAYQDVPEVAKINRPSEARLCAKHLNSGHIGFSVLHDGQLAGYAWAYTKHDSNIERLKIGLEPLDFLCNDAFTSLPFRGRGIQTSLVLARLNLFRELGYHRAICYIDRNNRTSIRVWEKLGGICIGDISYIRIGTWRWKKHHSRAFQ